MILFYGQLIYDQVENNTADDEGGGICLSDWTGTDLTIGGKMIVRNNTAKKDGKTIKSNLYLEGDEDLIVGKMSFGSEVGIRTETSASEYNGIDKKILVQSTDSSHLYFTCDEDGYTIKYQDDPTKNNYRYIYIAKGTRDEYSVKLMMITLPNSLQLLTQLKPENMPERLSPYLRVISSTI